MATKKGKHGGAREGSGRKARVYSDFLKKDIVQAMKKKAQEEGRTFGEVLLDLVYSDDKSLVPLRCQAAKIICDALLVKSTDTEVSGHVTHAPAIYLPEIRKPEEEEDEAIVH